MPPTQFSDYLDKRSKELAVLENQIAVLLPLVRPDSPGSPKVIGRRERHLFMLQAAVFRLAGSRKKLESPVVSPKHVVQMNDMGDCVKVGKSDGMFIQMAFQGR